METESPEKQDKPPTVSEHAPNLAGSVITADALGDEKIGKIDNGCSSLKSFEAILTCYLWNRIT